MKESKKIPQTNAEVQRLLTLLDMQNCRVEELEDLLNQKDGELSQKKRGAQSERHRAQSAKRGA